MVATAEITARLLEAAQIGLDRQVRARAGAGVRIHGIIKQGDPYRMVNETATEVGAGLIVMGTHGRKGLSRALLGSVAEKVVRTARIPVLTVHPGESKAAPHATGAAPRATETSDVNAASRPPISGSPASSRTP
jgi:nucleotide-binding universal stress UspA family protein